MLLAQVKNVLFMKLLIKTTKNPLYLAYFSLPNEADGYKIREGYIDLY